MQQGGHTIGKRARWHLQIDPTKTVTVQFHIGVAGGELTVMHAKEATPTASSSLQATRAGTSVQQGGEDLGRDSGAGGGAVDGARSGERKMDGKGKVDGPEESRGMGEDNEKNENETEEGQRHQGKDDDYGREEVLSWWLVDVCPTRRKVRLWKPR